MDDQMPDLELNPAEQIMENGTPVGDLVNVIASGDLLEAERKMLEMPQAECPVAHYFGPGVYIREVKMQRGTLVIGHYHRFESLNIVLQGSIALFTENGIEVVKAPFIYTGKPGKKAGYVLDDLVWQTIYATEETDIQKIEDHFIDKTKTANCISEKSANELQVLLGE